MSHLPDEVLAARAAQGHKDCFEVLLTRHRDRVFRLCYRMAGNAEDAEDWAQECFMRVYQQLGRYNSALPFTPWLLRVASNTCINLSRERARRLERFPLGLSEETVESRLPTGGDPLRQTLRESDTEAMREAIQELPPLLRQAVTLRVSEDLSFKEVAEVLGVPLATAATRVRRALLQIRERLSKNEIIA